MYIYTSVYMYISVYMCICICTYNLLFPQSLETKIIFLESQETRF